MSKVALQGNPSGTGTFQIVAPNSNADRTLTLPDKTATLATVVDSITQSQLATALNVSGDAPIYACRAWVNFNGTGTVAIRASGNVSSITDNGTGDYTVNFTTAMPDANYSWCLGGSLAEGYVVTGRANSAAPTASALRIGTFTAADASADAVYINVAIFR